jgi:hypothetical protein
VKERRTKIIAPIPQPISKARVAGKATHVPTPPLSGSFSIEALEGALEVALAEALAEGVAVELAAALALAVALAEAPVPAALSCTNKTLRLSAKTVPTANAL